MKLRLFYFSLIFFGNILNAQNFNNEFSFSLRGKYFLAPGWEDRSFRSYSYGIEFQYGKRFTFGIDGGAFRDNQSYDDELDVPIDIYYSRRTYFFADTKYQFFIRKTHVLYFSMATKQLGKYYSWSNKFDYPFSPETDLRKYDLYHRGNYTDYGIGVGAKLYFANYQWGLDVNFFAMYRQSNYQIMDIVNDEIIVVNSKENEYRPFFRVAFLYHFKRFEK